MVERGVVVATQTQGQRYQIEIMAPAGPKL